MAWQRIWQCGFELSTQGQEVDLFPIVTVTYTASSDANTGSRCGVTNYVGSETIGLGKVLPAVLSQMRASWFMKGGRTVSTAGYPADIITWTTEDNKKNFFRRSGDTFTLFVDSTSTGQSFQEPSDWQGSSYHHWGINIKSGASGEITVFFDGLLIFTYSGQLYGSVKEFYLLYYNSINSCGRNMYIDDIFIDQATAGEAANLPVPSSRFHPIWPNGAGSNTVWTPNSGLNYQAVDEHGANDGDTTYVATSSNGVKDSYNVTDVSAYPPGHDIKSVIVLPVAKASEVGPSIKAIVKTAAGELAGTAQALSTAYVVRPHRFTSRPGGGSWVASDITSLEIGVESVI